MTAGIVEEKALEGQESIEVRQESYGRRGEAWGTYFRIRLLVNPEEGDSLLAEVSEAIERAGTISKAESLADLHKRGEAAREALDRAVDLAGIKLGDAARR